MKALHAPKSEEGLHSRVNKVHCSKPSLFRPGAHGCESFSGVENL